MNVTLGELLAAVGGLAALVVTQMIASARQIGGLVAQVAAMSDSMEARINEAIMRAMAIHEEQTDRQIQALIARVETATQDRISYQAAETNWKFVHRPDFDREVSEIKQRLSDHDKSIAVIAQKMEDRKWVE